MKTASATIERDALADLRDAVASSAAEVARARANMKAAREAAKPVAFQHRDIAYLVQVHILQETDTEVIDSGRAWEAARKRMKDSEAVLKNVEREYEHVHAQLRAAEATREQQRRQDWAERNSPDIMAGLTDTRAVEASILANPYALSSAQGQSDIRAARARIASLEVALQHAAQLAPAAV